LNLVCDEEAQPFDVKDYRFIEYSAQVDFVEKAKKDLKEFLKNADDYSTKNSIAEKFQMDNFLSGSVESQEYILKILEIVKENRRSIDNIKEINNQIINQVKTSSISYSWGGTPYITDRNLSKLPINATTMLQNAIDQNTVYEGTLNDDKENEEIYEEVLDEVEEEDEE
jgi:hypothetical protein